MTIDHTFHDRRKWAEYDALAEWCAKRGRTGAVGTMLPANVSAEVMREIDADPEAFEERVRACGYALARVRNGSD